MGFPNCICLLLCVFLYPNLPADTEFKIQYSHYDKMQQFVFIMPTVLKLCLQGVNKKWSIRKLDVIVK